MFQLVALIVAVVLFGVAAWLGETAPYGGRLVAAGLAVFAASFIPDAL